MAKGTSGYLKGGKKTRKELDDMLNGDKKAAPKKKPAVKKKPVAKQTSRAKAKRA